MMALLRLILEAIWAGFKLGLIDCKRVLMWPIVWILYGIGIVAYHFIDHEDIEPWSWYSMVAFDVYNYGMTRSLALQDWAQITVWCPWYPQKSDHG